MLQVPATISKIVTMADKSLRLQVDTQELTPEASVKIFQYYNTYGVFVYSESEIEQEQIEVPEYKPVETFNKSPSKRLRDVLFVYWSQKKQTKDFDTYYKQQMELIINTFKDKLE